MEDLKDEARKRGLFNMFLPKNHFKEGAGFSNVEYGLMAEQLGKSRTASEVCHTAMGHVHFQLAYGWMYMPNKNRSDTDISFLQATNCAAPDTGNMEVIARYGTQAQKDKWLKPLLEGKIRSAFLMTEPDIASSDAANVRNPGKSENSVADPFKRLNSQCTKRETNGCVLDILTIRPIMRRLHGTH
jgi:acyl-CoA dehydrogenase